MSRRLIWKTLITLPPGTKRGWWHTTYVLDQEGVIVVEVYDDGGEEDKPITYRTAATSDGPFEMGGGA